MIMVVLVRGMGMRRKAKSEHLDWGLQRQLQRFQRWRQACQHLGSLHEALHAQGRFRTACKQCVKGCALTWQTIARRGGFAADGSRHGGLLCRRQRKTKLGDVEVPHPVRVEGLYMRTLSTLR